MERKLRSLVEGAGFVFAISMDQVGAFRVATPDLKTVGAGSLYGTKFRAVFPAQQLRVSTPTQLVDALEQIKKDMK